MPTLKQKKTMEVLMENHGKSVSAAMREAGYSPNSAKNPQLVTGAKGWQELLNEYLPDELLNAKIREGLEATRVISATVIVKSDDPKVKDKTATARDVDFIEVPDYPSQHKFLETALRVKDKNPATKQQLQNPDGSGLFEKVEFTLRDLRGMEEDHNEVTTKQDSQEEPPKTIDQYPYEM